LKDIDSGIIAGVWMSCQLFSQCADEDYVSKSSLLTEAENDRLPIVYFLQEEVGWTKE